VKRKKAERKWEYNYFIW